MNYLLIPFITGLTTGGLSCFALQGGLFSSILTSAKTATSKTYGVISFLVAKLFTYSLVGLLLGLVGSLVVPSPKVSGALNLTIALFMIGVALDALKIHPIFKFFLIQPPKFVRRLLKKDSKKEGAFTGAFLGASTLLIPCGTTQAMMALAVSSQSGFSGMLVLFAFILGTVPMFLLFGLTAARLSEKYSKILTKVVAVILIVLASYSIFYSFRLMGVNLGRSQKPLVESSSSGRVQILSLNLTDRGYVPQQFVIKKGVPVELTVSNQEAKGCIQAFVIPNLNKRKIIRAGESALITFTPEKSGKIGFTCSMGMYYGEFIVQ